MINDVMALREPGAVQAAADTGLPVCLMHMQGRPRTMQERPLYDDVVREVIDFLAQRVVACEQAGIARSRLLVDPGFGFGKSLEHNLSLLKHLGRMQQLELPVLVGLSRKSMLGALTARAVGDRVYAGIAGAVLAVQAGARIVRVHDVAATADALKLTHAVMAAR
jgi:dihydropteroate synthase